MPTQCRESLRNRIGERLMGVSVTELVNLTTTYSTSWDFEGNRGDYSL